MRDLVNRFSFLARKRFDNIMHWLFPNWWVPLYTSVTFSRMRYHLCIENKKWQDRVRQNLHFVLGFTDKNTFCFVFLAGGSQAALEYRNSRRCHSRRCRVQFSILFAEVHLNHLLHCPTQIVFSSSRSTGIFLSRIFITG